ncbi:nicotinamide-nucleotide amidohydrolase family protein [Georgenia satyanarayanai]|uniref:CinA family protein n=1 Tax=Georgenia satyanarayanai TaxID=860221 RepID=UPI00203D31E9|nr:nicotinamide-nucleotide amidohydrolase family protein [Georgenia satyanarayanai]MCM3661796.1 nicotinamide-nucleotide amidohydrolase family protein [Georgenia satyanarayanai]
MTAAAVVERLRRAGLTVATGESLTGGLVSAALVDVPGASLAVLGGVVTYATSLKAQVLGVEQAVLDDGGPVQAEVARQLALGAARLLGADCGIGTTGVAGPGPSDGAAAGTVFVAASLAGTVRARRLAVAGTRPLVRRAAVGAGLAVLLGLLEDREQTAGGAR